MALLKGGKIQRVSASEGVSTIEDANTGDQPEVGILSRKRKKKSETCAVPHEIAHSEDLKGVGHKKKAEGLVPQGLKGKRVTVEEGKLPNSREREVGFTFPHSLLTRGERRKTGTMTQEARVRGVFSSKGRNEKR